MRIKLATALLTFVLLPGVTASAQEPQDLAALKAQIQRLEAVDRDPTTSSEVRKLNTRFLQERREQLRTLLRKELDALQQYRATVGSGLSVEEVRLIDASIQKLTAELVQANGTPTETVDPGGARGPAEAVRTTKPADSSTAAASEESERSASVPTVKSSTLATRATSTPRRSLGAAAQAGTPPTCDLYKRNPKTFSLVDRYVCNLIEEITNRKNGARGVAGDPLAGLDIDADFSRLIIILEAKKGRAEELVRAEEARVDKQTGSDGSSAGTTSLVSKGNVPAILGFAVENGGLTQDVDGTTITFRGNPVGLFKAFSGKGLIGGFDLDDGTARFLRRFSFGLSFDTDRGSLPGTFTGTKQQLSSVSARAVLYDKRDPRRGEYKKDWDDFLATSAQDFLQEDDKARESLLDTTNIAKPAWKDPALITWFTDTQRALAGASPADVESVFQDRLNQLPLDNLSPQTTSTLADFERQFQIYLRDRNTILKKVGQAGVLTFDFVNERNINKPDLSHFRFVGEKGFYNGRFDLTGNASFSIFNQLPAGANFGRMRDAQAAVQLDGTFGSAEKTGVFVLSAAYKFQHLAENSMTQAGTIVPNTQGDIHVGQLKLAIPIKGLGIKLPISLTFANRTELVKEKEVRGNFGFTFDLDTIFARFKPF